VTGASFSILRKLSEARPKDSMTPATSFRNFRRVRPFQHRLKLSILQPAVSFFGLRAPLVSHLSYRYCLQFRSLIREELKFLSKLISSSRRVSLTSLFLLFPVRWVMERLRQLPISSFIYFRMRWRYQQVPALSILFIPVGYQQRSSRNGRSCSLRRIRGSIFYASGPFEGAVMDALRRAGIQPKDVHCEGFVYELVGAVSLTDDKLRLIQIRFTAPSSCLRLT